jgi:hypothetical protein
MKYCVSEAVSASVFRQGKHLFSDRLRIALFKGSARLGSFLAWRRKQIRLPKHSAALTTRRWTKSKTKTMSVRHIPSSELYGVELDSVPSEIWIRDFPNVNRAKTRQSQLVPCLGVKQARESADHGVIIQHWQYRCTATYTVHNFSISAYPVSQELITKSIKAITCLQACQLFPYENENAVRWRCSRNVGNLPPGGDYVNSNLLVLLHKLIYIISIDLLHYPQLFLRFYTSTHI